MKSFKYKATFTAQIKPIVSAEKDKYLAKASLDKLKFLFPDVNINDNPDLLPIASNATVINRVNLNGDLITTAGALECYKLFVNKYINANHIRNNVIGFISTVGFTEFGTDSPVKPEDIKDSNKPYNISLGGIIWRLVNEELADKIEESGDINNKDILSLSWEVGFSKASYALFPKGQFNLEDAKIIDQLDEIEKLEKNLISNGGSGRIEMNGTIYTIGRIALDPLPLGVGIVESPAAAVKGILTPETSKEIPKEEVKSTALEEVKIVSVKEIENNQNIISQSKTVNVKTDSTNMKITKIQDITDENLKEIKASNIADFINDELDKAGKKFSDEAKAKEKAEKEFKDLQAKAQDTETELKKVQDSLAGLEKEKQERQKQENFDLNMATLEKEYDFSDEDRKVIASQVKDLDKPGFEQYEKNAKVLFKEKSKAHKAELAKANEKKEDKVIASTEKVVAAAIEGGDKDKQLPNAGKVDENLHDKMKKAFAVDQFILKTN